MADSSIRQRLYAALPKPTARVGPINNQISIRRLLVLRNGPNPTFSYYLEERLKRTPIPAEIRNLDEFLGDVDPDGLFVIVCRYIRPRQLLWMYRHRKSFAGTSLMIDDDIAATVVDKEGTLGYKAYLAAIGLVPIPVLNNILSDIWVSTPRLADRLKRDDARQPVVLPPFPPADTYTPSPLEGDGKEVKMAFHSTGNHDLEHEFLVPIVRDALALCPNLSFEVTASSHRLERLWTSARLPSRRLTVKSHRSWNQYLSETKQQNIDILLVPLLQSRMNNVRSGTKRFDCARMGAAAIFSSGQVYGEAESAGEILIENNPRIWLETILNLARNSELRRKARNATEASIMAHLAKTPSQLPFHRNEQRSQDT